MQSILVSKQANPEINFDVHQLISAFSSPITLWEDSRSEILFSELRQMRKLINIFQFIQVSIIIM